MNLPLASSSADFFGLELEWSLLYWRRTETRPFARLPGFRRDRGHFVPDEPSARATQWAKRLLDEEVREELQKIYIAAKEAFGLRHGDVSKDFSTGEGSVESERFRYAVAADQDEDDPGRARLLRWLVPKDLPSGFEAVFPVFDEIVLPFRGTVDFALLMRKLEGYQERAGGRIFDEEERGRVEYSATDGSYTLTIDLFRSEAVLRPGGRYSVVELWRELQGLA